jgi:hypothetical protein
LDDFFGHDNGDLNREVESRITSINRQQTYEERLLNRINKWKDKIPILMSAMMETEAFPCVSGNQATRVEVIDMTGSF